jgi:hypothetical protein
MQLLCAVVVDGRLSSADAVLGPILRRPSFAYGNLNWRRNVTSSVIFCLIVIKEAGETLKIEHSLLLSFDCSGSWNSIEAWRRCRSLQHRDNNSAEEWSIAQTCGITVRVF